MRLAFKKNALGEDVEIFAEEYGTYVVSINKETSSLKAVSNSFEFAERLYRLFANPDPPKVCTDGGTIRGDRQTLATQDKK